MTRVAIVAEGKTELTFVREALRHELQTCGVDTVPVVLGGNVTIARLASKMASLFWSFDSVTSLVDYYGFRVSRRLSRVALQAAIDQRIKQEIRRSFDESKVFSYVQKYEFEGLLFSNTKAVDELFGESRQFGQELQNIRSRFRIPEDINDDPQLTPSRRIASVIPDYKKVIHGNMIARNTGIDGIRSECPRFHEWVSRLESLGYVR